MFGMKMMLDSMGVSPEAIMDAVNTVVRLAGETHAETLRQGRVIDAIARAKGIEPEALNVALPVIKED